MKTHYVIIDGLRIDYISTRSDGDCSIFTIPTVDKEVVNRIIRKEKLIPPTHKIVEKPYTVSSPQRWHWTIQPAT